jgi:hypothetical protein
MRALKSCIRVALVGGTLVSALAVGPVAAFAHTQGGEQAVTAGASVTPLAKEAVGLPKVSPSQLLKLAESQVGIHENAQGGGTKFQAWYMSSPRARETVARDGGSISGYADAAWCDMFVSWVGNQLGIRPVLGWDAYTVAHAQWFVENNRWGTVPKPGAVVFFSLSGGKTIDSIEHVGFVIKDNGNGTIQTVEGNTGSGDVAIRTRPAWQVVGYGYPYYTASDSA